VQSGFKFINDYNEDPDYMIFNSINTWIKCHVDNKAPHLVSIDKNLLCCNLLLEGFQFAYLVDILNWH